MSTCYLHISAGDGPQECQWVVVKLALSFCKEAKAHGLMGEILDDDFSKTAPSLLIKVSGEASEAFAGMRTGTIKWIGQSPFRPHHKRKNWYVGVSRPPTLEEIPGLKDSDISYQSMKASGPGGQHVNATQSAVRATHIPSGHSVVAREERSQHANKRLCKIKLAMLFEAQKSKAEGDNKDALWRANKGLERGNEVRVYRGEKFRPV